MAWDAYMVMGVNQGDPSNGYRLAAVVAESEDKAIELFANEFPNCEVATYPSLTQMRATCDVLQAVLDGCDLTDDQRENLSAVIRQAR